MVWQGQKLARLLLKLTKKIKFIVNWCVQTIENFAKLDWDPSFIYNKLFFFPVRFKHALNKYNYNVKWNS